MGVRDLKAFLSERGVSMLGVTEKAELVALAQAAVAHTAEAADEVLLLIWDTRSHWSGYLVGVGYRVGWDTVSHWVG